MSNIFPYFLQILTDILLNLFKKMTYKTLFWMQKLLPSVFNITDVNALTRSPMLIHEERYTWSLYSLSLIAGAVARSSKSGSEDDTDCSSKQQSQIWRNIWIQHARVCSRSVKACCPGDWPCTWWQRWYKRGGNHQSKPVFIQKWTNSYCLVPAKYGGNAF